MMNKSNSAFFDYRSPYAWQNRAINFNKQLLKKFNEAQITKKILTNQAPRSKFLHKQLSHYTLSSSISSSSDSFSEGKREIPFVKNSCTSTQNANVMHRGPAESNTRQYWANDLYYPAALRCPLHRNMASAYKSSCLIHPGAGCFCISDEAQELGLQSNRLISAPYRCYYRDGRYQLNTYPYPGQAYYSSHPTYIPTSYLPLKYVTKPKLPKSSYPPKTVAYQTNNHLRYSSQPQFSFYQSHHHHHQQNSQQQQQQQQQQQKTVENIDVLFNLKYPNAAYSMDLYPEDLVESKCKGHLIVLTIIFTVITIGVIMGIILAVTIN